MTDIGSWVASGGSGAILTGVGIWAVQFLRDGRRDKRQNTLTDRDTLLKRYRDALDDADRENERKDKRIDELEAKVQALYDQRERYEEQLTELRGQLRDMTARVDALQRNLHTDPPVAPTRRRGQATAAHGPRDDED